MLIDEGCVGGRAPVIRTKRDDVVHVIRGGDYCAPHHRLGILLGDGPELLFSLAMICHVSKISNDA